MTYLPSGATKTATIAGGVATQTLGYHGDGSVASLTWNARGATDPLRRHTAITYNDAGLRTGEQVLIEAVGTNEDSGGTAEFDYDLGGRLTSWTSPFRLEFGELDGPDSPTTSYSLDDAGNITRQELTTQDRAEPWEVVTASFNHARLESRRVVKDALVEIPGQPNQTLTGTTEQIFDHSHLGEETRRDATISYTVTGGVPAPDDDTLTTETSYDAGGTTRSQRHTGSAQDKPKDPTYFYDASGQVIARKSETKTSYLFYFAGGSRLAEEAKPDGETRTRFLNAPGGKVLAEQRIEDSEWVWLLGDPDGNVATELKETTGDPELKTQRAYDPYGSPDAGGTSDEPLTAPRSKSTLGYQSDNTDEDTGNLLLGPRLYDPEVNRFTSPDVFAAGGADMALGTDPLTGNRFMFAAANPVGFYEDGHRPACDSGGGGCYYHIRSGGHHKPWDGYNPETGTHQWAMVGPDMVPTHQEPNDLDWGNALELASWVAPVGRVAGLAVKGASWAVRSARAAWVARKTAKAAKVAEATRAGSGLIDDAVGYATRPERLRHIFQSKHGLDPLVKELGSQEAVVRELLIRAGPALPESGVFQTIVRIDEVSVTVRGAVVEGVPKIGTAFVPW